MALALVMEHAGEHAVGVEEIFLVRTLAALDAGEQQTGEKRLGRQVLGVEQRASGRRTGLVIDSDMRFDDRRVAHEVSEIRVREDDQVILQLVTEELMFVAGWQGVRGQPFGDRGDFGVGCPAKSNTSSSSRWLLRMAALASCAWPSARLGTAHAAVLPAIRLSRASALGQVACTKVLRSGTAGKVTSVASLKAIAPAWSEALRSGPNRRLISSLSCQVRVKWCRTAPLRPEPAISGWPVWTSR